MPVFLSENESLLALDFVPIDLDGDLDIAFTNDQDLRIFWGNH